MIVKQNISSLLIAGFFFFGDLMPIGEELAGIARHDIIASAVKAAPPISVVSAHVMGVNLPTVLTVLTILYTSLQIIFLLRDKLFPKDKHRKQHK